jgi:hypothetical protein
MPRDSKGNLFGHNSVMQTKNGERIRVEGFATIAHGRIPMAELAKLFPRFRFFRWTELSNVDEKEITAAAVETTDHCAVDRGQVRDGSELTASLSESESGDKVIWGS